MDLHLLLDTHIVVRWLLEPRKLSKEQLRTLEAAVRRGEPVAISATSLVEIAMLASGESPRLNVQLDRFLEDVCDNPVFWLLPITREIAAEIAAIGGSLRDPADRTIVATARIHHLKLATSDQRIVESKLVPVVE